MAVWEEVRHQVAIAGTVTEAGSGRGMVGALVEITTGPAAFTDWLAIRAKQFGDRWTALMQRPDRTRTARDGSFRFPDLPDGDYALRATLPETGTRYGRDEQTASVSRDADGSITAGTVAFSVSPTSVVGRTFHGKKENKIAMAEVRITGSGEHAFTDGEGKYRVEAIETGERTVTVKARGFNSGSRTVAISEPGSEATVDFELVKA